LRARAATCEERCISEAKKAVSWVVYVMTVPKQEVGTNAVCEQSEWDEMERCRPGYHRLVRAGITSESEAEKLARGTSDDSLKSGRAKRQ
jgi:hypothetical protein